jgi:thymidine kinase
MSASFISIEQSNKCGFLDIIIGPMYSGKTNHLLNELNIFSTMGAKSFYINSAIDNRTNEEFSTHNPMLTKLPNIDAIKVNDLYDVYYMCKQYVVIAIDEAQFFKNLKSFVIDLVEKEGKRVIIAGLSGNYKREQFGEVVELISYCDRITKLSSFFKICSENKKIKDAHFSYRLVKDQKEVCIGGKTEYIPLCRECFLEKSRD